MGRASSDITASVTLTSPQRDTPRGLEGSTITTRDGKDIPKMVSTGPTPLTRSGRSRSGLRLYLPVKKN